MGTIVTIEWKQRSRAVVRPRLGASFETLAASVLKALRSLDTVLEKRRSRRVLLELTDYQLKDIGLSRLDAINEAQRPFWQ